MSAEVADAIISTPVYPQEVSDAPATRRILITQDPALEMATRLQARFDGAAVPLETLAAQAEAPPFDERLLDLLQRSPVGTRLYVCGDEVFLWHVQGLARQAGLLDEEIELFRSGARRRLYCVHCSTLQEVGAAGETTCSGCGVRLLVRNHFSRRLGAYAGVCLNPDDPRGEGRP